MAGQADQKFTLARYLSDGTLDPSFGAGGVDTLSFPHNLGGGPATGVAIEPDGKIVAVGDAGFSIVRVNADGSFDQDFGTYGFVQPSPYFGGSQSVIIQPDGKILVGGAVVTGSVPVPELGLPGGAILPLEASQVVFSFELQRFNSDGSVDRSFGDGGSATTQVEGAGNFLNALALEPDGRIVAGGGAQNGFDPEGGFAAVIYNPNGTLDTGFANGGIFVAPFPPPHGGGFSSAIDSKGNILIAGGAGGDSQHLDFAVARVTIDSARGAGQTITATESVSTGQVVATFTDLAGLPLTDYSANINWGDGTTSAGTVSLNTGSGVYSVSGSHTYAEDGSDPITVTVHRTAASDLTFAGTATVVEPPLVTGNVSTAHILLEQEGVLQNVSVGTFTHGANTEPASDFTVTIDWGDGTSSAGTITATGTDYLVSGSHIYTREGLYDISATVADISGGASVSLGTQIAIGEVLVPGTDTPAQGFVAHAYADLLHRDPDAAGLAYWSAQLDGGATRARIVAAIESSDEYRHGEIDALFEKYLHRHAEVGPLADFGSLLTHGVSDEQIAAMIVGSDEYFTARGGGTNDGFLSALFEDALDRAIDPATKVTFEQLLAHDMTREQIAAVVFGTVESRDDLVAQTYLDLLDRPVDAGAQAYWAAKLADGETDQQVLAGLIASDEYFAKTP